MKSNANSYPFFASLAVDPLPPMSRRSATGSGSGFFTSSVSFCFFPPVLLFPFFVSRVLGYAISSSNSELLESESPTGLFFFEVLVSICFFVVDFSFFVVSGVLLVLLVEPFPHGPYPPTDVPE